MSHFSGRTIQVVRDLSVDEQVYLYDVTRRLKTKLTTGERTDEFRIGNHDLGVYLFFLEDSTRTKESFRNAAKFHGARVNDFTVAGSSINKRESITDTVKMLVGYSEQSVFIVRTKLEGTCRWLEAALSEYATSKGMPVPVFINAGDGRHEHPTQEFLDEFSFLEHVSWDRSHLHLALVGDLFHGRTVHSKVDGLRIFREVELDLVAPPDLEMPRHYIETMKRAGFEVRTFGSITEYLASGRPASAWYFTRLQLERMGDRLLEKADQLRDAVTFKQADMARVPEGTRFFHPLPRHSVTPTIPSFLDSTPLNGWDEQSINGYFTRIVEIGLVAGHLGDDFSGESRLKLSFSDDFVESAPVSVGKKPEYKVGIRPVESGIVIDHIGRGKNPHEIWVQIDKVRRILALNCISSHGVYTSLRTGAHKGMISLPDHNGFDGREIKMLAAIAPGCSVNHVVDGKVARKFRLHIPPRVYNLDEICCRNEERISHPAHHEPITAEFYRADTEIFTCKYCERPHEFHEIWK